MRSFYWNSTFTLFWNFLGVKMRLHLCSNRLKLWLRGCKIRMNSLFVFGFCLFVLFFFPLVHWFVCQHELWEIYTASLTKLVAQNPFCFGIHWNNVSDRQIIIFAFSQWVGFGHWLAHCPQLEITVVVQRRKRGNSVSYNKAVNQKVYFLLYSCYVLKHNKKHTWLLTTTQRGSCHIAAVCVNSDNVHIKQIQRPASSLHRQQRRQQHKLVLACLTTRSLPKVLPPWNLPSAAQY